jgi:hypothetical protein
VAEKWVDRMSEVARFPLVRIELGHQSGQVEIRAAPHLEVHNRERSVKGGFWQASRLTGYDRPSNRAKVKGKKVIFAFSGRGQRSLQLQVQDRRG